jgi:para-nitrobenzyl esterase
MPSAQPTYLYFFDHARPLGADQTYSEVDTPDKLGTFHSSEYPYIFGTLDVLSRNWTADDRALSARLQAYWTNFARSGNPNGNGLPQWPKFDAGGAVTMQLGDRTGPGEIPHLATLRFFDEWMQRGQ